MDDPAGRRALRHVAFAYFLAFGSIGIQMPLVAPALLQSGLGAAWIGMLWAARNLSGTFSPAFWGALADRRGDARPFAILSLGLGGLIFASIGALAAPRLVLVAFALYGFIAGAAVTLLDGMTLTALGAAKHRYGSIRLYGAVGFGIAALAATSAVARGWMPETAAVVFPLAGGLSALAAAVIWRMPRLQRRPLGRWRDLFEAVREGRLLGLGLLSLLHWASHGAYSALIAPLGEARGLGRGAVGGAMLVGIVVEVIMMRVAGRLLDRLGARRLLLWVTGATAARWGLLAATQDATSFIALQALHGISFGLFYPTLVALIGTRVREEAQQGTQGLFGALFFGVGGALGAALAGAAFERGGEPWTWGAMAALSGMAVVTAATLPRRGHA